MSGSASLAKRKLVDLPPAEVAGRRAFVRVDFNVPLEGEGDARRVASDARIRAAMPTARWLVGHGATVVLASHLGRPKGRRVEELSLEPIARSVEGHLGRPIVFLAEPLDERSVKLVRSGEPGGVYLLENLRFEPGETADDPDFANRLAAYGQLFVEDAFGSCHRAHASTVGVARRLEPRVAGRLVAAELAAFARLLDPERPFVAWLGGAKIAGKLEVVRELVARCDRIAVGGGMANTFLVARDLEVGDSLFEPDLVDEARELLASHADALLLPVDVVVAEAVDAEAERRTVGVEEVEPGWRILDVGPRTIEAFGRQLDGARTAFWNGPLGVFETPPFDAGTRAAARLFADATERGVFTVTGGGDSLAALEQAGLVDAVGHASTGGGAALELVAGRTLPGIEVLDPEPGDGG